MSHVHAEALAACPFSAAQDYAEDYLERAEAGGAPAEIRVPLRLFGRFAMPRRRVAMRFGVRADRDERGRPHEEIRLVWSARSPLLPDFHGTLRARIAGVQTRLVLDGDYLPPGGPLGRAFDAVVGRHVAAAGSSDFLTRLADDLGERERAWRSRCESSRSMPAPPR